MQVTLVNEQAERELYRPAAGEFLFVTVERVVEGDDGRRGRTFSDDAIAPNDYGTIGTWRRV